MFRSVSNIPIFRRLLIVFAVATVIPVIVIVLLGSFYLNSLSLRSRAVQTSFDAQNLATQQQINLQRMNALLQARFAQVFAQNSTTVGGDPSLAASGGLTASDVAALEISFNQTLSQYQQNYEIATANNMSTIRGVLASDAPDSTVMRDQQNALNAVSHGEWSTYQAQQDKVLSDLDANVPYQEAYADFYQANLDFLNLKNHWQQVVDSATTMGNLVTTTGPSLINPLIIYTVAAVLFTLLAIAAAGYLVSSTIVNPLNQLAILTRRIANGETAVRAEVRGRDEIYQVAAAVNTMLDHIVRLIREAESRHAVLQAQLEKLVNEVSGIGEGDLSIQAEVTTDELGVLADSFNFIAEELSNLVVNVKMLAHEVQNATAMAFDRMAQLVDNADLQIQQITQATSEVSEMATSSRHVADRAQELYNVAYQASGTAHSGRTAVHQTVEGMERINENVRSTSEKVQSLGDRSREISNIVRVISSIAHQTNRLALDAAIQAAMAGENGKGFGAVAVDIRRLAERAKEQATMITQIVRSFLEDITIATVSMKDTENETTAGTKLAHEVGQALESIFSVVEHQASEIEAINQVAVQQLQSSTTVAQIMQSVSNSTQQSSINTHDAAQLMEHLSRLAGQLLTSVEVFKLREDNTRYTVTEASPNQDQIAFNGQFPSIPVSAQSGNRRGGPTSDQLPYYPNYPNQPYPYPANQPAFNQQGQPVWQGQGGQQGWQGQGGQAAYQPQQGNGADWSQPLPTAWPGQQAYQLQNGADRSQPLPTSWPGQQAYQPQNGNAGDRSQQIPPEYQPQNGNRPKR